MPVTVTHPNHVHNNAHAHAHPRRSRPKTRSKTRNPSPLPSHRKFLTKANIKTHARTVIKRDGREVHVEFDKITARIAALSAGLSVEPEVVAQEVINSMIDKMNVSVLDDLAAETSAYMGTIHPDYLILAGKLAISNLHKETPSCFSVATEMIHQRKLVLDDSEFDDTKGFYNPEYMAFVRKNAKILDSAIVHSRDYQYDYFGCSTLQKSYLNRVVDKTHPKGKIIERPQYMLMRVASFINQDSISQTLETYEALSKNYYIHASPTNFNSGKTKCQLSSCFLLSIADDGDSIEGIFETIKRCAKISKEAGGIGLAIQTVRPKGDLISSSGGRSDGVIDMLKVFEATARYVDQGGNKRKGAFAIYLEPWHPDIFMVLKMKYNRGNEAHRCRDLFSGLWIPDLFMQRVEEDGDWTLMSPHTCPGLADTYGDEFKKLYEGYEQEGRGNKTIKARALWKAIIDAQTETGTPYILYKDACNSKSNQKNLGTIKCSNLCTEVVQYTNPNEVAVCNLCSIALPKFVKVVDENTYFDHQELYKIVYLATKNLNKVIDTNFYPIKEAANSNMKHRPVGIGVQGLADTFALLRMPFESEEAVRLNKEIFETMYFASLTSSMHEAKKHGPYSTFKGSPASEGILQFDMWGVTPDSKRWDWDTLKEDIKRHGLRNSLLLAPMPTASTSQILGNNEACEPFTRNIYVRRTMAGEFVCINKHLTKDLEKLGLWTEKIIEEMLAYKGSIQKIEEIPDDIKRLYKTAYEISNRNLINMSADRGAYICQSQSFNVFVEFPTYPLLNTIHFYAWKRGLKTGMYYLRSKSEDDAEMFTVSPETIQKTKLKRLESFPNANAVEKKEKVKNTAKESPFYSVMTDLDDSDGSDGSDDSDDDNSNDGCLYNGSSVEKEQKSNWVCSGDMCISCGS